MSLLKYRIDISSLSDGEKSNLIDRIDKRSFNGSFMIPGQDFIDFLIDEKVNVSVLDIPASCRLTHLYQ